MFLISRKPVLIGILICWLAMPAVSQTPVINEFMASNATTIADDDGDFSDWIELFNPASSPVDLTGCYLSDNASAPLRWQFPAGQIPAQGFLLVWASGKDRVGVGGELHTNFAISAGGEPLLLTAADGANRLDEVEPVALPSDISYGRVSDGAGDWYFFPEPTPGTNNSTSGLPELLEPPVFSNPGGWYPSDFDLAISTDHQGAAILYTLDGSEPVVANLDGNGPTYLVNYFYPNEWETSENTPRQNQTYLYTEPMHLDDRSQDENDLSDIITTYRTLPFPVYMWQRPQEKVQKAHVVRARALKDGHLGPTATATYFIHPDGASRYTLPVFSFTVDSADLFGYVEGLYVPGEIYFTSGGTEDQFVYAGNYYQSGSEWERPIHAALFSGTGQLEFSQNLGVRIHGNVSRTVPMKSLRLYARSRYDQSSSMDYPFLPNAVNYLGQPLTTYQRLLIRLGGNEMNLLTDAVAHQIMEPAQVGVQRSRPVVHFVNGEYWGLANIRDRQDEHYLAQYYGVDPDNVIILEAPWGQGSVSQVEVGEPEDILLYRDLYNYVVSNDMSDPAMYAPATALLDVDSYIDYNIMFIYLRNINWAGVSGFRYWRVRDVSSGLYEDGRWRVLVYDFDAALREPEFDFLLNFIHPEGGGNGWNTGNPAKTALLRNLLESAEFRHLFLNRFANHMNSTFAPPRVIDLIQARLGEISPEFAEHYTRWTRHATTAWYVNQNLAFAGQRPGYQRQHIVEHFDLAGTVDVTLSVNDLAQGKVQINTLVIDGALPGLSDPLQPYPWSGVYFQDVPITVTALPAPGHRFVAWLELGGGEPTLTLTPGMDPIVLTAVFASDANEPVVVHGWHFNGLPSGTLTEVAADVSLLGGAVLTYPGAGAGYMDRVSPGTELGALPDTPAGYALRARNPSDTRELVLTLPSTGHEELTLGYAVTRTSNGAEEHSVYCQVEESGEWHLVAESVAVSEQYEFFAQDLSVVAGTADNPDLVVKFTFGGASASGGSGNQRFDNVTLMGVALPGTNLPPQVFGPVALQSGIEGGALLALDLADVFEDPEGDPLVYGAVSADPTVATVLVSGSEVTVTPLLRGDVWVTVTATDGINDPAEHDFRVLIYPEAVVLAEGGYSFTEWDPDLPERTYPEHMLFLQSAVNDPGIGGPLLYPYWIAHDDYHADDQGTIGYPYNNTGRTRINGLDEEGISFINTGRGRDLGGALLALDTRGLLEAEVGWLGGTILPNSRIYAIRLQYRVGIEGEFSDVLASGAPVEYLRSETPGDVAIFGPHALPQELLGQEYLQLMWRYYHVEVTSGARAMLRLDEVQVSGTPDLTPVGPEHPLPAATALRGNAPNPFNPATEIRFSVKEGETGRLDIYDSQGRLVRSLGRYGAGEHRVRWDGTDGAGQRCASGVYFYRLGAESGNRVGKMALVK